MIFRRSLFVFLAAALTVCAWAAPRDAAQRTAPADDPADNVPVLLLISLDGFRWDYCEKFPAETPNLRRLKREGASARGLIPVFPSNTFPNHYSIVTGLRPPNHGIVNNDFFDAESGRFFHYKQATCNRDGRWWGGEPVWATAVRQGRAAACYFWPGSEAPIGPSGLRPTIWKPYNYATPFAERLAELEAWFRLPVRERPAVILFYLEETNSVAHTHGPDSPELAAAVRLLDARVGEIVARAGAAGRALNLVVVSDHGMTALSRDRVVKLDDHLDLAAVQIDFDGPAVGLRPVDGDVSALMRRLSSLPPHARAFRREELPRRFGLTENPRVPPVWILPEAGWHVVRAGAFNAKKDNYMRGEHGYDPAVPDMHGILIVHGPAFRSGGLEAPAAENIHIYNLLCAAVGLQPAANDGDDRLVRALLR